MTNEEKIRKMLGCDYCLQARLLEGECDNRCVAKKSAVVMAAWKDKQLLSILKAFAKWMLERGMLEADAQFDTRHQVETFIADVVPNLHVQEAGSLTDRTIEWLNDNFHEYVDTVQTGKLIKDLSEYLKGCE